MDIGVPLRDLGPVDVAPLVARIATLGEDDWTANTFRQDALAAKAHAVTDNILFKHEWHPSASTTGIQHFEDLIHVWATERRLDPARFLPLTREETDVWPVFTMPDYPRFRDVLDPIVFKALRPLLTGRGVITRLALVRLRAGAVIEPHIDAHAMATKAHRIHVSLSTSPSVEYKIDGRKYVMQAGHAYDFNNRVRHSVRNKGKRERVNLFVDYYPSPGLAIGNPLAIDQPLYTRPTPRIQDLH